MLRWVEAGCPDADMPGEGAKHTARALQGRRDLAIEEYRRTTFHTAMERWQNAVNMRAFCDALEHAAAGQEANDGELAAWLAWARTRADKIDPLSVHPRSQLSTSPSNRARKTYAHT